MFIQLSTKRGDYTINSANVLFIYPTRKGTVIEMIDGTSIEVEEKYDVICRIFSSQNVS